jgi:hypothetical protein
MRDEMIVTGSPPAPSSAVIVTSSSRSGSTWLADMVGYVLQLQQIYEPLHPAHSAVVRQLTGFDPVDDHVSSYYLRVGGSYPDWDRFLADVLTGKERTPWSGAVPVVRDAQGYLVKMIRASLMLGYLCDRFQPKVIHLIRHPCAVVASRLAVNWTAYLPALLRQEQLVEDYLRPWLAEIEQESDAAGAHAVCWAVENLVSARQLAGQPHCPVFYEHLMMDAAQEITRIAQFVGLPALPLPQVAIDRLSRTSYRNKAEGAIMPLLAWKQSLSQEQQRRVLDWAERLGVSWYGEEIWPLHSGFSWVDRTA